MSSNFNLTLHCGGKEVSIDDLKRVHTPSPGYRELSSGRRVVSHQPIGHYAALGYVHGALQRSGWSIENEVAVLNRDGAHAFGMLEVRRDVSTAELLGLGNPGGDGFSTVVAWRNSHDKAFPFSLGAGQGTWVCDNLCFFSEVQIRRRHTRYIHRDLPGLVDRTMAKLLAGKIDNDRRISLYQETEISQDQAAALIVAAAEAKVVGSQKIIPILQSFRTPEHPEFKGSTVYTLQNAFTEHFKDYQVMDLPRRSLGLNYILDRQVGFRPEEEVIGDAVDAEFSMVEA